MEQTMEQYAWKDNIYHWIKKKFNKSVTSVILQNLDSEHFVTRLLVAEQAAEKPEQSLSTN